MGATPRTALLLPLAALALFASGEQTMRDRQHENARACYETPVLVRIGLFEDITQGTSQGIYLNATFPIGTPDSKLTFSENP
jgi:hypothetical protein